MADSSHSTTQKPKLTREILEREGIRFFEKADDDDLPEWIYPIKEHLLHDRSMLSSEHADKLASELRKFKVEGQDREEAREENWVLCPPDLQRGSLLLSAPRFYEVKQARHTRAELKECEKIRRLAITWRKKQNDEPEFTWADLVHENVFRRFDKVHETAGQRQELFFRWEIHRDVTWNEFTRRQGGVISTPARTGPRPDLTYAFPIVDTTRIEKAALRLDPQVRAFSIPVLGELRRNSHAKLVSTPTTPLQRYSPTRKNDFGATNLMSFPWAVVETKKSRPGASQEEKCYCQAANASAQALIMREELAKKAKETSMSVEACVIFVFTCIGPSTKLWVTYRDSNSGGIEMRCIWASSLELTWGVLQLRIVVRNMHEWVYSRAKGEIARLILKMHSSLSTLSIHSQHRRRHSSGTPMKRTTTTPARGARVRIPSTAPPCIGRPSYDVPASSTPSRRRRNMHAIDDFIDDHGVSDQDWDGDYGPTTSSEESTSDSDVDSDDTASENESNDEVKDLIKDMVRQYPDLKERPDMKACFQLRVDSCSSDDEEQSEGHEANTDDGGQSDDEEESYYIDGKRVSNIFSRARQSLGMGASQVVQCSKSRRGSLRF